MRVLVTGGAGFIGGNLVRRLLTDDHEVVVLDDLSSGREENLEGTDVTLVRGSILRESDVAAAMAGAEAVVHLAAVPSVPRSLAAPLTSHDANATGTVRVLEAARLAGVRHVVVASSSSVYGAACDDSKHEDLPTVPLSPYGASKLAAEAYALAYASSFGLATLALRFFNVYGPLQQPGHAYAAVIPAFLDAALREQPVTIYGTGEQTRDFTFVDSVTDVIATALRDRVVMDRPVNLAFSTRTSLLELVDEVSRVIGRPVSLTFAPKRPGDIDHSRASSDLLRTVFPAAEPVPLAGGLAATAEWMRRWLAGGENV